VFCRDGQARLVAERETHEHVLALHRPARQDPIGE